MPDPQVLASETLAPTVKAEAKIDLKQKPPEDKTVMDFKNTDLLSKYVQQPTTSTPQVPATPSGPSQSVEEIRSKLAKEEEEEIKKMTTEDFEDIADLIMDIFDTVAIFGIRWYAQDDVDGPYQIPTDRMKKLKHRLSRLLMRMQAKIPLGFLFFAGLLMAYATPVRKAHQHRKEKMARQREAAILKARQLNDKRTPAPSASQNMKTQTTYVPKEQPSPAAQPAAQPAPATNNGSSSNESISPTVILDKDGNVVVQRGRGRPKK